VAFGVQNQQTSCSDWQRLFRTRGNLTLTLAVYLLNIPSHKRLILCPLLIATGFCTYPEHSPWRRRGRTCPLPGELPVPYMPLESTIPVFTPAPALVAHSAAGPAGRGALAGAVCGVAKGTASPAYAAGAPGPHPPRRAGLHADRARGRSGHVGAAADSWSHWLQEIAGASAGKAQRRCYCRLS
jgi:hypothetical protein